MGPCRKQAVRYRPMTSKKTITLSHSVQRRMMAAPSSTRFSPA